MATGTDVQPVSTAQDSDVVPPLLLFLPGLPTQDSNTSSRIADLISRELSLGEGTFGVQPAPPGAAGTSTVLTDCRRISRVGGDPVLDVCTVDYRDVLERSVDLGPGLWGAVKRMALAILYFARALVVALGARRRAKSGKARVQLILGFGIAALMLVAVAFTVLAVLDALGWWHWSSASETWSDAIALGATAVTVWLLTRAKPAVTAASDVVRQVMDYVTDGRFAAGVTDTVATALDEVLDKDPGRRVHLLGYSFGSLVAVDFLNPKESLPPRPESRYRAIASLTTIGCPLDFVRLFFPKYLKNREPRLPQDADWTNIFIAADVFGSNLRDRNDFDGGAATHPALARSAKSVRYTDDKLSIWNIWRGRGFLAHVGYWDAADESSCLGMVAEHVVSPV